MTKPLTLSVGIPTFNQAEYLEETLESLLKQTRPFDEILVSDHYSTDNTQQVLKKYAGRVKSLQPPPGVNLAGQYHFTLASQTGDWITLCSSDDVVYPHFAEVLLRGAARRDDAVLVRSGWDFLDQQGKSIEKNYLLSVPKVQSFPANLTSQSYGPKVSGAAFALRRDAYAKSGPILETLESLVDWALFLQVAPFGPFVYEHDLISGYRVGHDGNKFRDRLGMWVRDQQRIFATVMPLAAERGGMQATQWIVEASRYNCLRYLSTASKEFLPAERAEVVQLFAPWAAATGTEKSLQAFAAGKRIDTPIPLGRRVRRMLKPYLHRLIGTMQRR